MKFTEGQRVMVIPQTVEEAMAGWEQPEGTVVAPGAWTLVLIDEEFRPKDHSGLVEYKEEQLLEIEPLPPMLTRRQAG